MTGTEMMAAKVATSPGFRVGSRTRLFPAEAYETAVPHANYDVQPDGTGFVMVRHRGSSQIILVQNWVEELSRSQAP